MNTEIGRRLSAAFILLVVVTGAASAAMRTWTDKTGKITTSAELVEFKNNKAVLRLENGKQITVPLERLSDADQEFLKSHEAGSASDGDKSADATIADIAARFYGDLRNQERTIARQTLTKKAEALMSAGQSPLAGLPQPDKGAKAIVPGDVHVDGDTAEIPVVVRAAGHAHKTKLHLRKEGDDWHVFALSATYPDGEKSINFEAANTPQKAEDPLQALLGKPFELEGFTIEGARLNMEQFKGKVVLVDFWATWCGPCRAEIPNVLENWNKHHDDGFEVIAVSVDEDLKALQAFVAEEKPPWTVVADNHPRNKTPMGGKYGIRAIPAFVLIGKDGNVAAINCRGARLGQELEKQLSKR